MSTPTTRVPQIRNGGALAFFGAGLTHAGLVRDRNEDAILTDPTGTLWAVADGMGGYGHGDIASDMVIEQLSLIGDDLNAREALCARIRQANSNILDHMEKGCVSRMGATAVVALIQESIATIAWAGDCRAYLLRDRVLRLLTRDHTVVQEMVEQGLLREEERERHPDSHVVTRAIGVEPDVEIDVIEVPLARGDRLVMCSDGLTTCLNDREIADHMLAAPAPHALCMALVTAALRAGAPDNVSVVSVFAKEG